MFSYLHTVNHIVLRDTSIAMYTISLIIYTLQSIARLHIDLIMC